MAKKKTLQKPDTQYNEKEWTEPKTGQWSKEDRLRYIKQLGGEIGLLNVNKSELAKKFGISRQVLYEDFETLYKQGLDKNELEKCTLIISDSLKKANKELHSIILRSKNDRDKIAAINSLVSTSEKQTDFLERFGMKDIEVPITDSKIEIIFGNDPTKMEDDANGRKKPKVRRTKKK